MTEFLKDELNAQVDEKVRAKERRKLREAENARASGIVGQVRDGCYVTVVSFS